MAIEGEYPTVITLEQAVAMGLTKWAPRGLDVDELREELTEIKERARIIERLLSTAEQAGMAGRKRRRRENTRLSQIQSILREENRPLHINAIYQRLKERDHKVSWKQPTAAFRSYLRGQESGPDEVVKVGPGTYGLRCWLTRTEPQPPIEDASES